MVPMIPFKPYETSVHSVQCIHFFHVLYWVWVLPWAPTSENLCAFKCCLIKTLIKLVILELTLPMPPFEAVDSLIYTTEQTWLLALLVGA